MIAHEVTRTAATCARCGAPVDSRFFDESGFTDIVPGARVVLARFELPRRFCGLLEYFSQFTDRFAANPGLVETPELEWSLLVDGRALAPYAGLRSILNPWGFGAYQTAVRLDEGALVEFVLRVIALPPAVPPLTRAGGRITGRYWFSGACADVDRYGS